MIHTIHTPEEATEPKRVIATPEHVFLIIGANRREAILQAALLIGTCFVAKIQASELDHDGVYRREGNILHMDSDNLTVLITDNVPHAHQPYDGALACWLWPYEARAQYPKLPIVRDINTRTPAQVINRSRAAIERNLIPASGIARRPRSRSK